MYPQNADELTKYLQQHPELSVLLPAGPTVYTFQQRQGNTINFATRDQRVVTLHLDRGHVEYHADGFTRRVSQFAAEFQYTGGKPWQNKEAA